MLPVKFNQQVRNFEVSMNSLRKGTVISHKGKIWVITDYAMHSQGRQGSHYKVEMRDLLKGGKVTERCNPTATFEGLDLEDKHFQFLYADGGELHLMDKETMDIHQFPIDMIEGGSKSIVEFLNEDMDIKVSYHEDTPVRVKVPPTGVFKVEFTDPPAGGAQQSDKSEF
ncbi:hypothetical protein HK101_002871 [Irineochytrium annulatum]|nr:hypothetical protein HK101_002871 [Irineochytrium annulatum]